MKYELGAKKNSGKDQPLFDPILPIWPYAFIFKHPLQVAEQRENEDGFYTHKVMD